MSGIPFGKYQLIRRIARGGMAEVFLATQRGAEGFERPVAVKRILPHLADEEEFVQMFLDEAQLAIRLTHPNICHIYEFGKVDDSYFIAMEYIDGIDLSPVILQGTKRLLPLEHAVRIIADVCTGLEYAHNQTDSDGKPLGLVHRDISPQNILVSFDGVVKVVDFGIAKAAIHIERTRPGVIRGKYTYMSPEQVEGHPLDGRSDIFCVGIVLYELCSGKTMFPRTDAIQAMKQIRAAEIPPFERNGEPLPRRLREILARSLARRSIDRYSSAADLQLDLEDYLRTESALSNSILLQKYFRQHYRKLKPEPETLIKAESQQRGTMVVGSKPASADITPVTPYPDAVEAQDDHTQENETDMPRLSRAMATTRDRVHPSSKSNRTIRNSQPRTLHEAELLSLNEIQLEEDSVSAAGPTMHTTVTDAPSIELPELPTRITTPSSTPRAVEHVRDSAQRNAVSADRRITTQRDMTPHSLSFHAAETDSKHLPSSRKAVRTSTRRNWTVALVLLIGLLGVGYAFFISMQSDSPVFDATVVDKTETRSVTSMDTDASSLQRTERIFGNTLEKDASTAIDTVQGIVAQADVHIVNPNDAASVDLLEPSIGYGTLSLRSTPSGATVTIDGISASHTTPSVRTLVSGTHTVVFSYPEYQSQTHSITIERDKRLEFEVVLQKEKQPELPVPTKERTGYLSIQSTPWVKVYVDGEYLDSTPMLRKLSVGKHTLKLVQPETGAVRTQTIRIKPGKTLKLIF